MGKFCPSGAVLGQKPCPMVEQLYDCRLIRLVEFNLTGRTRAGCEDELRGVRLVSS